MQREDTRERERARAGWLFVGLLLVPSTYQSVGSGGPGGFGGPGNSRERAPRSLIGPHKQFYSGFPRNFQDISRTLPRNFRTFPGNIWEISKLFWKFPIKHAILLLRASGRSGVSGAFGAFGRARSREFPGSFPGLPGVPRDHQNHPGGPPEPLSNFPGNFSRGPSQFPYILS